MRCVNVERGCDWQGTVGMFDNHVTKCGFTLISCPNKCKVEGEKSQVMRKDLDEHLENKCLNRDYICKHCGEKGTYASITEVHDGVCIKKVVPCPHTDCTVTMERGLAKKHVQTVCKYTLVACKYASIGCSVMKVRMDMDQHEKDNKSHLCFALEKIVQLEETTSVLKKNMYTLKIDNSISFNLPGYSLKKEDGVIFYSEPFYTSPGGYKMCIVVYPNGNGDGRCTHVSVFSKLLEGPYDDTLPWPFLGSITVNLLNQLADDNHHCKKIPINTKHNAQVGSLWGYSVFLPHSKLSHDQASNTQYLMEDNLYFRVIVELDQCKPWLNCSYHTK